MTGLKGLFLSDLYYALLKPSAKARNLRGGMGKSSCPCLGYTNFIKPLIFLVTGKKGR